MREVMHEGMTGPRVALGSQAGRHAVALGALEGLDGEITIMNGDVWISRVRDGDVVTSGPAVPSEPQATLLVVSHVPTWRTIAFDAPAGGAELEAAINRAAMEQGIDTSMPFPFIIDGVATSLDMHVINGFCPHGSGEVTVGREPLRIMLAEPTPVSIIGFYAEGAQGILTHHGTSIHAHALLDAPEGRMTGHIDSVEVADHAVLRLPANSMR